MNKQELIEKYTVRKTALKPYCPNRNRKTEELKSEFLAEFISDLNQLDEQPKVTVPQFVAKWINQCKEKATLADCLDGYYEISNGEVVSSEDFQNWVADNENDELTAKAWIFGYEVEKEPLYQIELPGTSWGAYLTKADNGDLVIFQNTTSGSTFTESEIKSIDERYWAFAVQVEEVK